MDATKNTINAKKAATAFLERNGYEVVETLEDCGVDDLVVIARDLSEDDEGTLVFVQAQFRDAGVRGLPPEDRGADFRSAMERVAMRFLTERSEETDCRIRFDIISVAIVGESRAFLRHHLNAFSI